MRAPSLSLVVVWFLAWAPCAHAAPPDGAGPAEPEQDPGDEPAGEPTDEGADADANDTDPAGEPRDEGADADDTASQSGTTEALAPPETPAEETAPPGSDEAAATKTTVDGFPESVDLYDESTWSDLTVEQKDALYAERARRRTQPDPVVLRTDPASERAEVQAELGSSKRRHSVSARKLEWWNDRDRKLRNLTIGFGVTWGIATVVNAIIWAIHVRNANTCIDGEFDQCARGAEQSTNLIVPGALAATVAGVGFVGTVVSGSLLGAHRNNRPIAAAPMLGPRLVGLGARVGF